MIQYVHMIEVYIGVAILFIIIAIYTISLIKADKKNK